MLCIYFIVRYMISYTPSGESPTDPTNLFSVEFIGYLITDIPHVDIAIVNLGSAGNLSI